MASTGRYSRVSRRIWNDAKFRQLSSPPPCGKSLFLRLLVAPEMTCIPGLIVAWEAGLAESMGWPLKGFRESFRELFRLGLVEADFLVGLVWIPKAIFHNEPANPNIVSSWESSWAELPECKVKSNAFAYLNDWANGRGNGFGNAFRKACPNHLANHCRNQEQEQEQDQEQEQEAGEGDARGGGDPGLRAEPDPELSLARAIVDQEPATDPWGLGPLDDSQPADSHQQTTMPNAATQQPLPEPFKLSPSEDSHPPKKTPHNGKREPKTPVPLDLPRTIPPDWTPSQEQVSALASSCQTTEAIVLAQVAEFRFYWVGEGRQRNLKGWTKTFSSWVSRLATQGKLHLDTSPSKRSREPQYRPPQPNDPDNPYVLPKWKPPEKVAK